MDQKKIEDVKKELVALESLDVSFRPGNYSRGYLIEIDRLATKAIELIEELSEEVERLEGELAEVRAEAEAHNATATQYEKDIAALREEVARG